jgi:hypothetical protein
MSAEARVREAMGDGDSLRRRGEIKSRALYGRDLSDLGVSATSTVAAHSCGAACRDLYRTLEESWLLYWVRSSDGGRAGCLEGDSDTPRRGCQRKTERIGGPSRCFICFSFVRLRIARAYARGFDGKEGSANREAPRTATVRAIVPCRAHAGAQATKPQTKKRSGTTSRAVETKRATHGGHTRRHGRPCDRRRALPRDRVRLLLGYPPAPLSQSLLPPLHPPVLRLLPTAVAAAACLAHPRSSAAAAPTAGATGIPRRMGRAR